MSVYYIPHIPHFYTVKLWFTRVYIVLLFLIQNIPYFAMYCAHSCITRIQFLGVKSGEKSPVPIHNTRQI